MNSFSFQTFSVFASFRVFRGPILGIANLLRLGLFKEFHPLRLAVVLSASLFVPFLGSPAFAASQGTVQLPVLEFIEPTNNAVYSTSNEIPIRLRAAAPDDVFVTAEVFANNRKIASLDYCCDVCLCAGPREGQESILQFWMSINGAETAPTGQLWENMHAGIYVLTARALGENGTLLEADPVTVRILDLSLRIDLDTNGAVTLVIPQGSLIDGRYDLEMSEDLRAWKRLGPFQPGNVASFYFEVPPEGVGFHRFYRSIYVPPNPPVELQ